MVTPLIVQLAGTRLDPARAERFLVKIVRMKLALAVAGLVVLAVASALAVQQLNRGEQFRVLMASGDQALEAGNTYAAIESYSGAVALRPDSMASHLRRGKAYEIQRRQEEAIRDYVEAARLQSGAADPLLALADLYDARGDVAHAAEWYGRAAEVDPQNRSLLYRLALARYRAGRSSTAIDPLRRALALDGGFDEAHYLLGVVLRDAQDVAGATASLERAIQANPSLIAAREELADVYRAQGRFADELAQLTALAAADPKPSRVVAIALAEARQGRYDAALATLNNARQRDPGNSLARTAIGRVHVMRAEATADPDRRAAAAEMALPVLEAALGGDVRRSEGLALYGRAVYLAGDVETAERLLEEAVATSPFDRYAFLYLADAAEALRHYGEARNALARFDALEGDAAPAGTRAERARRLGGLALVAGDPAAAVSFLDRARQLGVNDPVMLGWLAESKWKTGDRAKAIEVLDQALAMAPRDPALRRLKQTIK
jgi:tetratricopeptide (TPR) repeat protein